MLSCFLNLEFLRTVVAGDQVSSEVIADLSLRGWTFYKADPRLNSASFLADIFLNSHTGKLHAKTPSYCDILNAHSHFYLYSRKTVHSKVVTLFRRIPVSQILESRKCNKSSKDGNEAKKHDVRWEANSVSLPSNLPVSSEIFRITDFFPLSFGTGKEIKFVLREPRSPGYLALNQKRLTLHVARALNTAAWWFPRGFVANVLAKKGNKVIGNKQFNIQVSDNSLKIKGFDESVSKRPHGRSRARRDLSSPKFPRASYSTDVPEDASIGHTVLALTAQSPGGKIRYSMSSARSSRSERLFGINPDTGVITVREKLDRDEGDPQHDFQVKATLETDNLNYGSTLVTIVITDVNDNKPVFEKTSYSKSVNEMFPPGNQLLQVRATDKDKDRNGQVKYSIDNPSGVNSAFSIDSTYGSIRLRKQLDREVTSSYTLRIKAEDNGDLKKSSVVTVTIIVLDDNDNSPQFSKFPYRITIPEDTAINSVIETIHAEDKDEGNNKIITYSMVGHYLSTFSIHPSSGELRLKKSLDYENRWGRSFALHVRATDGGQPQRMNQTVVHIRVTDVNDNPPVFRTRNMVVTVPEYPNTQVDSVIFRGVHADDRDEGNNGKVVYSLGVVPSNFPFAVNPDNGLITATGKLDYEKNNVYRFEVVARDKGNPPKEAKADVTVKIQNINDNSPLFQKQNYQVNITEDTRPESSIFGVTATDKDEPVNPNFQYSITGGDTMGCFQIDFTGTIYLKCPLNYDQQPSYRLTLKVTDQSFVAGGKTLSSTASLVVKVLDANTNTPEFTKTSYSCDVKEGEPVGSLVCKVSASDGDTGENAKITYSIEGNDNYFSIDPNTGDIKVAKLLDREKKFSHSLTVRAADHGVPQLIAFTFVLINVKDINDNAPVFGSKEYTAEIPENIAVDREVIQVSASDQDFGGNREIEYSFAPFGKLVYSILLQTFFTHIGPESFIIHLKFILIHKNAVVAYERSKAYNC